MGKGKAEMTIRAINYIQPVLTFRQTNYAQEGRRQRPFRTLVRKLESLIQRNPTESYRSRAVAAIGSDTPHVEDQESCQACDR